MERKLIISAVIHDNVKILQELLAPKWYQIKDDNTYNLLQIAILRRNTAVFNYMLSLDNFPLELTNWKGDTALMTSLGDSALLMEENLTGYFASELIKKGAKIEPIFPNGETILNRAVWVCQDVALILIKKGVDVNLQDSAGNCALNLALHRNIQNEELISALLCNGAVPAVNKDGILTDFEYAVLKGGPFIQELLFLFSVDFTSQIVINLRVLVHLALTKSVLFHEIMSHVGEVIFNQNDFHEKLFLVENPYFEKIASKCNFFVDYLRNCVFFALINFNKHSLDNICTILNSRAGPSMRRYIQNLNSDFLIKNLLDVSDLELSTITQIVCFLVSHGLSVSELSLQTLYSRCGKCELFEILRHMDVKMDLENNSCFKQLMPALLYDVKADIDSPEVYSTRNLDHLLEFSAHPKITQLCWFARVDEEIEAKVKELPKVPLLVELARNASRKFVIEKFQVQNVNQFSAVLKKLPISRVHEAIIKFETKLY